MSYNVNLEAYEGPLDLLLGLITKNKIDIHDIPIHLVTEQFIAQIKKWEEMNLEVASDFIVMAATLLEIKSKLLLPKELEYIEGDEDESDPREELVRKLIEYKLYKDIAENFKVSEDLYTKVYYKPQEDVSDFRDPFEELGAVKLEDLVKTLETILLRYNKTKPNESFYEIQREEVSVEECTRNIRNRLLNAKSINFSELLCESSSVPRIIGYFLSILELVRLKFAYVKQNYNFSDLIIEKRG
ncbi:MAG: segregation/condensation protein A [Gudongella sp.]|nr:segregation/condensation protein A [Gudongella sp.]